MCLSGIAEAQGSRLIIYKNLMALDLPLTGRITMPPSRITRSVNMQDHNEYARIKSAATVPVENAVKDVVCGMTVTLGKGKPTLTYKSDDYHFCGQGCHDKFNSDPYFYLSGNKSRKKYPASKNTTFTCPMDPEVIQEGPGTCPACGMALEPMDGIAEGPNHELIDFTKRLMISVIAAIPLLILTMGPLLGLPIREWLGEKTSL